MGVQQCFPHPHHEESFNSSIGGVFVKPLTPVLCSSPHSEVNFWLSTELSPSTQGSLQSSPQDHIRDCHKVPDTVCADVQERKCQITQRPVQQTVSRKEC